MLLDPIQTLCELVAIPSVNPMGLGRTGPEFLEARVTTYLEQVFQRLALPCLRQTVEPQRDNILARIDGRGRLREQLLLLEAHQDTVPVDGMTIEPWNPQVRDGRVYGRGACDIKGGLAAMLAAVSRVAADPPADLPTILLACTINEEHGYTGATALGKLWSTAPHPLVPRRPDAAVVAEPTELDVVVAHKGTVRWRCHTLGRAVHSSRPELGDNAVYRMARVLPVLDRYNREVLPAMAEHPLCGRPTLSVGTIRGGLSVNTVPDRCTIEIDRRLLPGEEIDAAQQAVIEYVRAAVDNDDLVRHDPPHLSATGLADGANAALAQRLLAAAARRVGPKRRIGVPYGTDASAIHRAGVPAVVFGPGCIDQAHTADEWVAVDQIHAAADVYEEFLRTGLE